MIVQRRPVGHARVPQLDRRHHQPLLEDARGVGGHRAGHRAADVVVVAERLHERDHLAAVEDRHGHAQVGQVADAALGQVDVVVEEDVARAHRLQREVAHDRMHQGGVRAAGQLAQQPVVDAGPEVVRVADHRRPRRCARSPSRPPSRSRPGCPATISSSDRVDVAVPSVSGSRVTDAGCRTRRRARRSPDAAARSRRTPR